MTLGAEFRIAPAESAADLEDAGLLFDAYAASLTIDLTYQGFAAERAGLPGRYSPPGGALLLARGRLHEAVGCVGVRPIEPAGCCEMKRLYVAPAGRGAGVGRALVGGVIRQALSVGYREMRLDTLASMADAVRLYRRIGFQEMEAYYATPIAGTIFMRLRLAEES